MTTELSRPVTDPSPPWPPPILPPVRYPYRERGVASRYNIAPVGSGHSALGRRFWALWTASLSSGLGDGLVLVAFPLLAARLSHDARYISGVAVAASLPWLLFGLPAGVLADRLDRRRLMLGIEVFRAGVLLVLGASVVAGWESLPLLYATVFCIGAGQTAFTAAAGVELPRLVRDDQLGRANGYLLAAETTSEQTIGPALGGLLFAAAAAAPFVLDGVSFVASAILIGLAVRPKVRHSPGSDRARRVAERTDTDFVADLRAGWRHFVSDELLVLLAAVIAVLAFCQAMVLSTLVLSALRVYHVSGVGYGLLWGASAVGGIAGGIVAGRVDARFGPALTLSISALIAGFGYAVIGFTTTAYIAGLGLAVEAVAVTIGNASSMTLRQRIVPDELRGRVGNIIRWCIFGAIPLGAFTGGLLAQKQSLRTPFLVAAAVQIVAVSLFAPRLKRQVHRRLSAVSTDPFGGLDDEPPVARVDTGQSMDRDR